jgi:hypothetical protein
MTLHECVRILNENGHLSRTDWNVVDSDLYHVYAGNHPALYSEDAMQIALQYKAGTYRGTRYDSDTDR